MAQVGTDDLMVESISSKKIKCFVTGKLRSNTPEERIRQDFARTLVHVYGYELKDLDVEFPIKMGRARKKADIVIFQHEKEHIQENIHIIIEAKREDVKSSDKKEGVDQLKSYCSASIKCKFGLWIGNEKIVYKISEDKEFISVPDIPRFGDSDIPIPTKNDLKPAVNLKQTFKRIHNYIYVNQGLPKDGSFEELQKLIFCKVYDEQYSSSLKFYILPEESTKEFRKRIDNLFENVKKRYQYIFKDNEKIILKDNVLQYIVSELHNYSFLNTTVDIKGEAYQEIIGSNLRGDRGEFFTPRNVTYAVTEMLLSLFDEEKLTSPGSMKILDPALGTGGFLISSITLIKSILEERGLNRALLRDNLKEIALNNLYGIDFNPFLVKVAQMNMVMHGDGSSNIFQANSLEPSKKWDSDAQRNLKFGTFDVVLTNPPFGATIKIDDNDILEQYDLIYRGTENKRSAIPPEQLFIERCLDFLKPGGYLGIVLPDSILSNPGLTWIREYIFEETYIVASIDLPPETFQPHTGTQTSVLILKKKQEIEKRINEDYDIFMALPEFVGIDRRGKPLYKQTPDGQNQLDEKGRLIINDSLPLVVESFKEWIKDKDW